MSDTNDLVHRKSSPCQSARLDIRIAHGVARLIFLAKPVKTVYFNCPIKSSENKCSIAFDWPIFLQVQFCLIVFSNHSQSSSSILTFKVISGVKVITAHVTVLQWRKVVSSYPC